MGKQLIVSALLSAALASAASAEEVTLRVADSLPTGHYIGESLAKAWMDRVGELTNGEVAFEYYPAQQLGKAKDLLSLTQTGVTDVGYVGVSYTPDKLPLSSVAELPGAFSTSCEGTLAYWSIAKPGGVLDKAEISENGVRMLMVMVLSPYQVFMKSQELAGVDSFSGQKIRATGGTKELAVERLGGVPVAIPGPEVREALARGTIDGIAFPAASIKPYDLAPLLKYATRDMNFGSFIASYMISESKWSELSPETQAAMAQAGDEVTAAACKTADELDAAAKQEMAEQGVTFVDLPDAERAKIGEALGGIGKEWAADLDGRGKAGAEVLGAFQEALGAQ